MFEVFQKPGIHPRNLEEVELARKIGGWSTVEEIGGGPMAVVLDGVEVEIDVEVKGEEVKTPGVPTFKAKRLESGASMEVLGFVQARPLKGCLGCSCGACDD